MSVTVKPRHEMDCYTGLSVSPISQTGNKSEA